MPSKQLRPLSIVDNGRFGVGVTGLEPVTSSLSSKGSPSADGAGKGLAATPFAVCTRVCTSEGENVNAGRSDGGPGEGEGIDQGGAARGSSAADQGDPLAKLVAALLTLSPADRARLAGMLAGHQSKGEGGSA